MFLAQPVRMRLALAVLLLLSAWQLSAVPHALAWRSPGLVSGIPNDIRSPKIAGESNRVHMITFQAASKQLLYSRGTTSADGSVSWERPRRIADEVKLAWNITADGSGTVHVAYATTDGRILYIKNPSHGDFGYWSAPEQVAQMKQANELDIALDSANTPYIVWGQNVDPSELRMSYRVPGGSWVTSEVGGDAFLYRYATLVVTGAGDTAVVHILSELKGDKSSRIEIIYASGPRDGPFRVKGFSTGLGIGDMSAQPTMALDRAAGTIYAGFFSGRGLDFEFIFSYSRNNGASWTPATTVQLGENLSVVEKSPMVAGNNRAYIMLQVKRVGDGGFASSGFYATEFNQATGSFTAPQPLRDVRGTDYKNVTPDFTINAQAKVGVWAPGFTAGVAYNSEPGSIPSNGGTPIPVSADAITINGGAPTTRSPSVTVAVVNPKGSPTRMRVAIDGPLTPATPSEPFQASFSRTLPAGCQHTISLELQNDAGAVSRTLTASIAFDAQLDAFVSVRNPRDGAPEYTREPNFRLQVIGVNECSGLKSVRGGPSVQSLGAPASITNNVFDAVLPLPAPVLTGSNQLVFQVDDAVGNTGVYTSAIIYDPTPPTLVATGKLTVTLPTSGTNIVARLVFSGSTVRDTGFGGRGFWGVQLLNSRTPITDTAQADLRWATLRAPGDSSDFTLPGWSLLTGITPAERTSGAYYVYARFVDGAGNPTTGVVSGTATLDALRPVEMWMPLTAK